MTRSFDFGRFSRTSAVYAEASCCARSLSAAMGTASAVSVFVMAVLLALRLRGLILVAIISIIISLIIARTYPLPERTLTIAA